MQTAMIQLKTAEDVKQLVSYVSCCGFDVDLVSGRSIVDGKSIMGIFSLDLAKPIRLEMHSDNCAAFLEKIESFLI